MELKTLVLKEKLSFDQFKAKVENIAINTFKDSKAVPSMLFGYCEKYDHLHAIPMDGGLTTYPIQTCIDFMKDFIKTRNINVCAFLALGKAANLDDINLDFPVVNISIQKPGKETYISFRINPDKTLGERYEFDPESRSMWSFYPQVN
jgi:hypothetical protein